MRGFDRLRGFFVRARIWGSDEAQDLVEYALMAGFVATVAGALMPHVAESVSTIMSKISGLLSSAAKQPQHRG